LSGFSEADQDAAIFGLNKWQKQEFNGLSDYFAAKSRCTPAIDQPPSGSAHQAENRRTEQTDGSVMVSASMTVPFNSADPGRK